MKTTINSDDETVLPVFPGEREAHHPLDPPEEYADWRENAGLQRALYNGQPVWMVSRFSDIRATLTDPRISADNRRPGFPTQGAGTQAPPAFPRMDAPEHTRLRRMLAGEFTVRRMELLRPQIEGMVEDFLDRMISKGQPGDLVRDFALPVPSMVISVMLGVPYEDHEFFQRHSGTMVSQRATVDEKAAATMTLVGYMLELLTHKESDPADDILSRQAERVALGEISRETAATNAFVLLFAGHETTANMIGLGVLTLLQNPAQLTRIRDTDDPALIANAVEELLRYLTIAQGVIIRVAIDDVEIGGQLVRAGEGLIMNLPTANRDETVFAQGNAFDIHRNTHGHLAFGYGAHQCLGQALARLELQVALPALLRRLPNLRLAVPMAEVDFRHDMDTYGVRALPIAW